MRSERLRSRWTLQSIVDDSDDVYDDHHHDNDFYDDYIYSWHILG